MLVDCKNFLFFFFYLFDFNWICYILAVVGLLLCLISNLLYVLIALENWNYLANLCVFNLGNFLSEFGFKCICISYYISSNKARWLVPFLLFFCNIYIDSFFFIVFFALFISYALNPFCGLYLSLWELLTICLIWS